MAKPAPKLASIPDAAASIPEDGAEAQPKKKSKKKLVLMLTALLLLGGGGGAAWYFNSETTLEAETKKHAEPAKPPVFVTLENFTVNLQPEVGDQYLQTAIVLKVASMETSDLIKMHMPEVRNRILLLLSSKKASGLTSVQGKEVLSSEILALLKKPFSPQGDPQEIESVFFTSFVIQ